MRETADAAGSARKWIAGIYAFNVNGGSAIVSGVLEGLRTSAKMPGARAGHVIGILERMAMLTLVWLGEWSALGFVLAAKRGKQKRAAETTPGDPPTRSLLEARVAARLPPQPRASVVSLGRVHGTCAG